MISFISKIKTCNNGFKIFYRTMSTFGKLSIRSVVNEERINIKFSLDLPNGKTRLFTFDRSKDEELSVTIQRLSNKILKESAPKKKKKKEEPNYVPKEPVINLFLNDVEVDKTLKNTECWAQGSILKVDDKVLEVDVNIPVVNCLKLPETIMAGFPLIPKIETEFVEELEIIWFKGEITNTASKDSVEWVEIGRGPCYTVPNNLIGCHIKVTCLPKAGIRQGEVNEVVSKDVVQAGPGICPFETRHLYCQKQADENSLRVISYNILADAYADSEFSRTVLYPYCPDYALAIDYRIKLITKELLGYNADLICLQECDRKVFNHELESVLSHVGFRGHLKVKTGQVPEGTAVFYRTEKLNFISDHSISIKEDFNTADVNSDIREAVKTKEELEERMENRNTTLQVLLFESRVQPSKKLIVATTHLYFRPNADHIRVIQAIVCVRHIEGLVDKITKEEGNRPSVLFCGDLNSNPSSSVVKLLSTGTVSKDDPSWKSSGENEFCGGVDFQSSLQLSSAYSDIPFTNYVGGFQGTLDWIFFDKSSFSLEQSIPLPSIEEVTQHGALPSVVFPSDHLALVCDISFKNPR